MFNQPPKQTPCRLIVFVNLSYFSSLAIQPWTEWQPCVVSTDGGRLPKCSRPVWFFAKWNDFYSVFMTLVRRAHCWFITVILLPWCMRHIEKTQLPPCNMSRRENFASISLVLAQLAGSPSLVTSSWCIFRASSSWWCCVLTPSWRWSSSLVGQ